MEHTVKKSRGNRIALRSVAFIFLLIAILRIVVVIVSKEPTNRVVTVILCGGCLLYGLYLLAATLRPQAYDITYVFLDKTFTMKMHRKEKTYSYGDIKDLGYVIPNESLDYSMIQIYIGKEQYTIPFNGNSNVGEGLYGMLKLKRDEALGTSGETTEGTTEKMVEGKIEETTE